MRLGTCIALELAVAAGAVSGVWLGVSHALDIAGGYLDAHEAVAATIEHPLRPDPLPKSYLAVRAPRVTTVFPAMDDELLAPIGITKVTHLKLNHGGTSLSLRLDFANGARAAFKPEQTHPQSDPRREIAAYRIDRLLGIGHVAPAKSVVIPVADLLDATEPGYRTYTEGRLEDEGIIRDGKLRGEVSWWVPAIKLAKVGPYRVDESEGEVLWTAYLQAGAKVPDDLRPMVEQLSSVILFDVLIDNPDRWTGSNTMATPDQRTLYFMDNTLSFSVFAFGHESNLKPLHKIQVFSRSLVQRMRGLTLDALHAALVVAPGDPLGPLLDDQQLRALLARRDHLVQYIDDLIAELGENAVLAIP